MDMLGEKKMKTLPKWQTSVIALVLWGASMPIYLFEYRTREGTTPFYVWNLYNHIIAFSKEPVRAFTDGAALLAIAVYSIPSFFHIGLCLGLGSLIHWGIRKVRNNQSPNKNFERTA